MAPQLSQAFILCGPGDSLSPFNSNPSDHPKALLPIANRPMIWYPLEWCHRMGISSIYLVAAPSCLNAIQSALATNPYLTSLPAPKASILSPPDLELTTATAEIFRLPEVQDAINGDFVVLPCDLVCELHGLRLLEMYTTLDSACTAQDGFIDAAKGSHSSGMGVWYDTRSGGVDSISTKKEETDFIATTSLPDPTATPPDSSLRPKVRNVVLSMPADNLDEMEEDQTYDLRDLLMQTHQKVQTLDTHRDAHVYFFPAWVKHYLKQNGTFESFGEDVIGFWAKAGWQGRQLAEKLGISRAIKQPKRRRSSAFRENTEKDFDVRHLSSTAVTDLDTADVEQPFASRVQDVQQTSVIADEQKLAQDVVPSLLAYIHDSHSPDLPPIPGAKPDQNQPTGPKKTVPLIRRVDTVPLLLSVSLYIARLPTHAENPNTPTISHPQKIHPTSTVPQQASVSPAINLIDANVTLNPRITIRESVVGANCIINSGARITRCVLMEGVTVEEKAVLDGCVVGRYAKIGAKSELKDSNVQAGFAVAEETVAKGEELAGFEGGLGDEDEDMEDDAEGEGLDLGG